MIKSYVRFMDASLAALVFVFALLGVLPPYGGIPAYAATTYYVATTGSDSSSGTLTNPFRTVNKGVSVLNAGDTLYIRAGTYAESLNDNIPSGTSWTSPVTVAAYPGETVTLQPSSGVGWVLHFQGAQQYIVIDGLILDGVNVSYDAVKITDSSAGSANHIKIQNTEIKNAAQQGVLITGRYSDYNVFTNLNVHNNRGVGSLSIDHYHGFYIETSNNLVEKSAIHDNTGYGVHIYNGDGWTANNNIVRGNNIYHNGLSTNYSAGMILGSGNSNAAYNNLVWNNQGGIQIAYTNPSNTQVYNNTVYGNKQFGVYVNTDSSNAVIENNIFYADTLPEIQNSGSGTVLDHNLTSDPKFVNVSTNDFHQQSTSPAIDAGITISSVTTDFDGVSRPQGSAYDEGAYEYKATDTTAPIISAVVATSITTSDATIAWTTNEASDSQVEYGLTTSYGSQTTLNTSLVTSHSVALSGLSAGTLYHYRVKSKDALGNLAVSGDYTFTTTTAATFSYSLSNGGSTSVVTGGASVSQTITATYVSGTASSVLFSASGLPSGATASFVPTSCTPNTTCSVTLTITTGISTPTGSYTIIVTGSPNNQTTSFALAVTTATAVWINQSFPTQTGTFTASFDATPNTSGVDVVNGLSASAASAYTNLAAIVRFNITNTIDARNGGAYAADVSVPYSAGVQYHFRMVVNVPSHVYTAYVTPAGGSEVLFANNYAFRTEQTSVASLANIASYASTGSSPFANLVVTTATFPVISNVAASGITQTGATISWTTNEVSDSQVEYGPTTSYGFQSAINTTMVASHSVVLSGLTAGTVYHYRVKSKNASGNLTVSPDATFTTAITTYTITASAGAGGVISPPGPTVSVNQGASQTFTITPNSGYAITSVVVDGGTPITPIPTSYTFNNVQSNHSITVSFAPITAAILANPSSIGTGDSSTLTWNSTNATSCAGTNFSTGGATANATGVVVTPSGSATYTLTCTGVGGSAVSVSAAVTVNSIAALPNIFFPSGSFSWNTANATTCTGSGGLSGSQPLSSTQAFTIPTSGSQQYTLTCTGGGVTVQRTVTISVSANQIVSTKFSIGSSVTTTASLNVRSAPSLTASILGQESSGATGTVAAGPVSDGTYWWWQINYSNGLKGWSVENWLK